MTKALLKKIRTGLTDLRADERAAESSEVILVLVVLVIGLLAAWAFLKGKIMSQATKTGNCIGNADSATRC